MKNLALLVLPWGVLAAVACNSKGAASSAPPPPAVSAPAATIAAPGSAAAAPVAAAPAAAASAVTPTPNAAPAADAAPGLVYSVVGVVSNDVLNVREKPEVASKKVYSYAPVVKNIHATGQHVEKGATPWVEVSFDGGTGWVNRLFLSEVHPPQSPRASYCARRLLQPQPPVSGRSPSRTARERQSPCC